jgi:hypothetical protein
VLEAKDVIAFNEATVKFADRSVYAFEKSLETQTLVNREMNRITFGENAFIPTNRR